MSRQKRMENAGRARNCGLAKGDVLSAVDGER